jgi:ribulose-bisphosphate carboxylase small chain
MKLTQGAFSFLPDLTDEQITKQIQYALNNNWAVSVEYTDDPHPRNSYWEMWGLPLFDIKDPAAVLFASVDEPLRVGSGDHGMQGIEIDVGERA